jgi:hypothetical protein
VVARDVRHPAAQWAGGHAHRRAREALARRLARFGADTQGCARRPSTRIGGARSPCADGRGPGIYALARRVPSRDGFGARRTAATTLTFIEPRLRSAFRPRSGFTSRETPADGGDAVASATAQRPDFGVKIRFGHMA